MRTKIVMNRWKLNVIILTILLFTSSTIAQTKPRARDLGIPFDGSPGANNAITDVKGVEVGYTTLISGEGETAVRTGVTAILPQGKNFAGRLFAAWHTLNGNGEMTGTTWVQESGGLGTPILITNTHSVGVVRDAVIEWGAKKSKGGYSGDLSLPVVAETWDGFLNDINGFHVKKEHVFKALDTAASGPIAEGNVGGGTGMSAHQFKAGTGTSSRVLTAAAGGYTVGVLVQANYGARQLFTVAGAPVGREITDLMPLDASRTSLLGKDPQGGEGDGSIIVVLATDAPLLPHQLKRIAQRISLGVGKVGGRGENSSGDIFIAFSTANAVEASKDTGIANIQMLPNDRINMLFWATAQAVEEAIINAMVAAETVKGYKGNTIYALPHDRLKAALRKYNRLVEPVK
jgi:D-aminopeptidase